MSEQNEYKSVCETVHWFCTHCEEQHPDSEQGYQRDERNFCNKECADLFDANR